MSIQNQRNEYILKRSNKNIISIDKCNWRNDSIIKQVTFSNFFKLLPLSNSSLRCVIMNLLITTILKRRCKETSTLSLIIISGGNKYAEGSEHDPSQFYLLSYGSTQIEKWNFLNLLKAQIHLPSMNFETL